MGGWVWNREWEGREGEGRMGRGNLSSMNADFQVLYYFY